MNKYLTISNEALSSAYPDKPFTVRHELSGHPLFSISHLLELQKVLPQKKIDYYTGKVDVNTDRSKTTPTGLTPEETIRRIKECESWLVLKNVEQVPEYRQLLEECLGSYRPMIEAKTPGIRQLEAWIFITSPHSIAPYHLDPEHNLLLQIHGPKTVHIFDSRDPEILSDEELERYYAAGAANPKLEYNEAYREKDRVFVINPGDGVHIPYTAPHWVKVEDEFSISFSVSFYSRACDRRARLYRFNSRLRWSGLTPATPGKSPIHDAAKDAVINSYLKIRGLFRPSKKTRSKY